MMRQEKALEYFREGYNCCRATLMPFADIIDVDEEVLAKVAGPFGAGISRLREVCGAVSGMTMAIGMIFGTDDISDKDKKEKQYSLVSELANKFIAHHCSIRCRELLKLENESDFTIPSDQLKQYDDGKFCENLICDMVSMIEDVLRREGIE